MKFSGSAVILAAGHAEGVANSNKTLETMQMGDYMKRGTLGLLGLAVAAAGLLSAPAAQAQDYPVKPIKFVVSSQAGGVVDIRARRFGARLGELLKQPIVVENKPGASTTIGADYVAKSPPDGYTALFGGNTEVVVVPALGMPIRYDPVKDLTPVAQFTLGFPVMVVNSTMGVKTLAELIEWAKARPGQLTCGTAGHGSGQHFICELLARSAKIQLRSVPYKGTGPMLLDVASGNIHVAIGFLAEVDRQYIVPGKVIPVGTLGPRRLPRFPNLPTMGEMGHVGFDMLSWTGLFVPGGTPRAVITRLNAEITKVVREPEFATWLAETGSEVVTPTPEEFASFTRGELERWRKMSADFGIKYEP
ncbi:MAG: tripartite tricarboxylate transporter substrate binding protein [Burkholderiaceae bacterium]|nr:tripartite tricarboxylate transporter substrate binding protein [Burkholderiaceae bacterium]